MKGWVLIAVITNDDTGYGLGHFTQTILPFVGDIKIQHLKNCTKVWGKYGRYARPVAMNLVISRND